MKNEYAIKIIHEDVIHDDMYILITKRSYSYILNAALEWYQSVMELFDSNTEEIHKSLMIQIRSLNETSFFPLTCEHLLQIYKDIIGTKTPKYNH